MNGASATIIARDTLPPPPRLPGAPVRRRAWPLLPLAPAIVVIVGLAVTAATGVFGFNHLRRASDAHVADRAELLAATVAARLGPVPYEERLDALQLAARRTGAEFIAATSEGTIVQDASLGGAERSKLRDMIPQRSGQAMTGLGRTRFSVAVLGPPSEDTFLIAFVRQPDAPDEAPALVRSLLALTMLLVGVAAMVAYWMGRDVNKDVEFVTHRVRGMLHVPSEPTGEPVPVRTMDEVGALTSAFNELVGRFAAAERTYREDLERVRAADRDRAAFLAAVSHELRSPLNAILGFADLLMAEVDGPLGANAREEVEQIRGSGQHLLELISDILEFSALESEQLKLSRGNVALTALAHEVAREAAVLLGTRPIVLRVKADEEVHVDGDARRLRQVLTNLVGNALKFTQKGQVLVTVAREGAFACLSVRDTGPGISAAERAMIFDEYKQASEERIRKRGTGLGLAITRRLVLLHGGSIHVESELGSGSVFKVLLPLWGEHPAKWTGRSGSRSSAPARRHR